MIVFKVIYLRKNLVLGYGRKRGRERDISWCNEQFIVSMISFRSFVLLLWVREWGKVKTQLHGDNVSWWVTALLKWFLYSLLHNRKNVNAALPLKQAFHFLLEMPTEQDFHSFLEKDRSILCFFNIESLLIFSVLVKRRSLLLISNLSAF